MKIKIIIASAAIAALALIVAIGLGLYPVAMSYNWMVSARHLNRVVKSSINYYEKAAPRIDSGLNDAFKKEIRRATLEKLIVNEIIHLILKQNLGRDLDPLVSEKLSRLKNEKTEMQASLNQAVQMLYNLPYREFEKQVLVPQTEQEILEGQLYLRNVDYDEWLAQAKDAARPIILLPDLYWKNGRVETSK